MSELLDRTPINWVEEGAVTDVVDQGHCGSDWAIATAGAIEGAYFVFSGTQQDLRPVSPQ